mmetsp:Transcript_3453/g.13165  ORF Transcript_3453/g.13165 Transcript_3453/m.13165 type:complete len:92 (-) Transcript_3453:437-712(-)
MIDLSNTRADGSLGCEDDETFVVVIDVVVEDILCVSVFQRVTDDDDDDVPQDLDELRFCFFAAAVESKRDAQRCHKKMDNGCKSQLHRNIR